MRSEFAGIRPEAIDGSQRTMYSSMLLLLLPPVLALVSLLFFV